MNKEDFANTPAGRLMTVGKGEAGYVAFVPNPLPPRLTWTADLMQVLSRADRAVGELAGLGRYLPNPHLLISPFIRREAVLSSRIEGTRADLTDLFAYEARQLAFPGMQPSAESADVREVHNYVRAMEYGLERLSTLPISLRFIRELHERLLEGVRGCHATPGEFRYSQNWIGAPECTLNQATYVPPPPDEMRGALSALEDYLHANAQEPPLVRLALIHYQFEAIHPFVDGNGRLGRLLISLLLVHWGLLPLPLLYLSAYFESHRQAYYNHLLAVSRQSTWTDWLVFFLGGVAEQADDALLRARQLSDLRETWRQQLGKVSRSAALLRLVDYLFESPVLTIPQAQAHLDVTYHAARQNVQRLVEASILQPVDDSRYGKTFLAAEILRAAGGDSGKIVV